MIVIPMAGLSSRFFNDGFTQPKYMLDLHGRPVFDHALGSFRKLFSSERFLLICRDVFDTPRFVLQRAEAIGLKREAIDVIVLENETRGQAETVAVGLKAIAQYSNEALTIFNIDTFRPGFSHPTGFDIAAVEGYLEVFEAPGDHWSFVKPVPGTDRVEEVAEKTRISDLCSNGLYHFRSVDMYLSLFANVETENPSSLPGGEYYVAPLYNIAIAGGADIRFSRVPAAAIRLCGKPTEYSLLCERPPFSPESIDETPL